MGWEWEKLLRTEQSTMAVPLLLGLRFTPCMHTLVEDHQMWEKKKKMGRRLMFPSNRLLTGFKANRCPQFQKNLIFAASGR